ncbi:hypothetical protein H2200_009760 [Cladophialophora chaetospira]|uniref:Uncharacterized protein n=1 Tax=Cladophialophora chaetospira TaxID=386627 RepID=A0AA38X317_9EURO|nr:hypothetical protein H2200_009760 [Cladophialophora chaetospira]
MAALAEPQINGPHDDTSDTQTARISIEEATKVCQNALRKAGYSGDHAAIITDHLIDAEMRGHPFAGLARALSIIDLLKSSDMKADKQIEVTRNGPTFAQLDGHDSAGYIVAREATRIAIEKAKAVGVSVVGAENFWYTGNLAYYAEMATKEDLVIFIASNGTPIVAPHGGYEPKFCTNPFCIGFPSGDSTQPVIWDIGTSNIMYAQIKLAERLGSDIPEGSAFDSDGNPTTEPLKALQGALTVWGGHKGSGLAMMIQLLGIAAGSLEPVPFMSGFGFLVLAFDPGMLQPIDQVKQRADMFSNSIRQTKMLPGESPARMPFERSIKSRTEAREKGYITVPRRVIEQLQEQDL